MPLTFWAFYALVQLVPRQWTYSKSEIRLCVYFMAVQCCQQFYFGEFQEVRNFHLQPFWEPIFCEIWFFKDASHLYFHIFSAFRILCKLTHFTTNQGTKDANCHLDNFMTSLIGFFSIFKGRQFLNWKARASKIVISTF